MATTISRIDLEVFQHAVLALHAARDLASLRQVAPRVFRAAIPADLFTWIESAGGRLDGQHGETMLWEEPQRSTPELLRRLEPLLPEHPFAERIVVHGERGPFRLSDFWTRRQQLASAFHREFYQHLGIDRLLCVATVRRARAGAINLARHPGARDFSERDRALLGLLAPHFVQALDAAEQATARHESEARLGAAFGLTAREAEVAAWLVRGRTNAEIARILAARPRTVEKHVEKILDKLGVENRTAAARVIFGRAALELTEAPVPAADPRTAFSRMLGSRPGQRRRTARR